MSGKRQKTHESLVFPKISQAGLAAVLNHVKTNPAILSAATSRQTLGRNVLHNFDAVASCIKLPLEDGSSFDWHVLLPQQLIPHVAASSSAFARLLDSVAKALPPSEIWKCILYHDEITPGNVLRVSNARKFTAFYLSFYQFSMHLRCEDAWLCIAVLRHDVLNKVAGQVSGACKLLLRAMFMDGDCNLTNGIVVHGRLFVAVLSTVIADEAALKATWAAKGSSGLKPCVCCKNIIMQDAGRGLLQFDHANYLMDITCSKFALFDLASNDDIWYLCDRLQNYVGSKAGLENLEKACGLNRCPEGVLADAALRTHVQPAQTTAYDSMHCFFSHGVAALELHLFLEEAKQQIGIRFKDLDAYCNADWRSTHEACKGVFSKGREAATKDSFKGMASEVLYVYPLVEQFAATIIEPTGRMQPHLLCFYKMCTIIRLLQDVKMQSAPCDRDLARLQNAQDEHLAMFCDTYGPERVIPKHHYAMHIAAQIRSSGILLDTFVLERKHRSLKAIAEHVAKTALFERSLLARHLAEATGRSEDPFTERLLGPRAASPDIAAALGAGVALVAETLQLKGHKVKVNDVLCSESHAYEVLACMQVDSAFKLLARPYSRKGVNGHGRTWQAIDKLVVIDAHVMYRSAVFWSFDNGQLLTLP